jgi:hypothetical protein
MPRALLYLWALPTTCLGIPFLALAWMTAGGMRWVDGVLEVHGRGVTWLLRKAPISGGASAMTLGHIVVGCDIHCLERTRRHERVHVRQVERWGPLFIPAYFTASLIARLRGGDAYLDNCFEREAYDRSA